MDSVVIKSISIAAPAFNEEQGISAVVDNWAHFLTSCGEKYDWEIVICNDGSKDRTGEILNLLARKNPRIKPVHLETNQGAAVAFATAIKNTTKEWVLLLDSDGQFPIENLMTFEKALQKSNYAYIGYREKKADSLFARLGSYVSGALANWFHGTHYRDFNCALKLVWGPIIRSLNLEAKGLNYSTEMTSKLLEAGVLLKEVPSLHAKRSTGRSTRTFLRGSWHRFLFVLYIGIRQFLFRMQVLRRDFAKNPSELQ